MTLPELEQISIVEPPLRELKKHHSFLGNSCFGGCGFMVIIIVFSIISIKLFLGPGPVETTKIPSIFPTSSIPIYDEEHLERVTIIPGRYTTRGIHLSALLPELLFNRVYRATADLNSLPPLSPSPPQVLKALWEDLFTPAQSYTITTRFEWHDLEADPTFIRSFYEQTLEKRGFKITHKKISLASQSFNFTEARSFIDGSLLVEKTTRPKSTGTARVVLIVRIPEKITYLPEEASSTTELSP